MSNQQGEVMNPMFSNMPNDTGFVPSPVPYGPVNSWSGNAMNTMRNGMTGMQIFLFKLIMDMFGRTDNLIFIYLLALVHIQNNPND